MTHYVCTGGCGAHSLEPGFCQEESCSMYGAPLVACECSDGNHEDVLAAGSGLDTDGFKARDADGPDPEVLDDFESEDKDNY